MFKVYGIYAVDLFCVYVCVFKHCSGNGQLFD